MNLDDVIRYTIAYYVTGYLCALWFCWWHRQDLKGITSKQSPHEIVGVFTLIALVWPYLIYMEFCELVRGK